MSQDNDLIPMDRTPFAFELLQATGGAIQGGHRVRLVKNGEIFDRIVALAAQATRSLHLTVFMWKRGEASQRVIAALGEAVKRGVTCRVALDAVGSRGVDHDLGSLRRVGCEARIYRAPFKVGPRTFLERSHRKIMVVDGRVGLTGGFGIRDVWLGDGLDPSHWRDTHVELEGPAVRDLQLGFADVWTGAGGAVLGPEAFPVLEREGDVHAAFIRSQDTVGRSHARRLLGTLVRSAKRRLWLATGYFAPGIKFRSALIRLARSGVDVRVLMPGRYNDVPVARMAQRWLAPGLARHGVRMLEYQPSMTHTKVALMDDEIVSVGSINLDFLSFRYLEEGSLLVQDRAFAAEVARAFEADFARAREVPGQRRAVLRRYGRAALGMGAIA
jgi:cardiolipin synthase